MTIDFTAKKLEQRLQEETDPLHFEALECLYNMYLSGDVDVKFVNGEAFFSLTNSPMGEQLELPLE